MNEQMIVDKLCEKFAFLQDQVFVQRQKRIVTGFLNKQEFKQVLSYIHDELGFCKAHHVVGTDEGSDLGFVYIFSNSDGIIFALKEKAPKSDPKIDTLTDMYPSLLLHERELIDLFGAQIEGIEDGPNYPLPDGWPEGNYPMRKEWKPEYFDKNTMTYNPPEDKTCKEGESK